MARSFAYQPVRTAAPAATPVSLEEAKAHLRVDHEDEDALIGALIEAATAHLDGWSGVLGRALVTQTWRQTYDDFTDQLRLPLPAKTIVGITYVDPDGLPATVSADDYVLLTDARGSFVEVKTWDGVADWPSTWDGPGAVAVEFTCGEPSSSVPPGIKAAILLMVGHWYANREAVTAGDVRELPMAVDMLIRPHRRVGV